MSSEMGDSGPRAAYVPAMTKQTGPGARVVICCYCDARSLLPQNPRGMRLVCHGCGAPILKILAEEPRHTATRKPHRAKSGAAKPAERDGQHKRRDHPAYRRKGNRKKKGWFERITDDWDDVFDLDDLFDLEDLFDFD
ncbi:MAG: hypothetical protein AAGI70_10560 [Pseudomonadota bacterium]